MKHFSISNLNFALIILAILNQPTFAGAPSGYIYPNSNWLSATPESQGVDSRSLNSAIAELKKHMHVDEMVVVRRGRLLHKGSKSTSRHRVWSAAKVFTSTTLGVLIDQRKVRIDEKASVFESSLKSRYSNVTLRHFATMTSGYDATGGSYGPSSKDGSSTPFSVTTPLFSPGSYFSYWDDAMNMFGKVLSTIAGKNFALVFNASIAQKIGIKRYSWPAQFSGISSGSGNKAGLEIDAEEMARLGLLYLTEGNWDGEQILSREWVNAASTLQVSNNLNMSKNSQNYNGTGRYGYNWWLNTPNAKGERLWPSAPAKTFAAMGSKGNLCFVIPEWDMVVVRLGTEGTLSGEKVNSFFKALAPGVK